MSTKLKKIALIVLVFALSLSGVSHAQNIKDIDDKAKASYEQARQSYLNEIENYNKARRQYQEAKLKFLSNKTEENKSAYRESLQNFLEKTVSALIKYLEALRNKASNIRGISEDERNNMLSYIDTDINWLKNRQTLLLGTITDEQLKNEAVSIRDYWPVIKTTFKKTIADIWIARMNYIISKAGEFASKIASRTEELKVQGKDIANLEKWLKDLNSSISTAKEKLELARTKRQSITQVNFEQAMKEISQFVNDANKYIRTSHSDLVKIAQELKKISSTETPQ